MRTINRNIVGAFIFSRDGKLVVGKNIGGGAYADKWVIPGGGIEEGETEVEALKREVAEEIGLDIEDAQIERIETNIKGSSNKVLKETGETVVVDMVFSSYRVLINRDAEHIRISDGDGFGHVKWLPPKEFNAEIFSDPTVENLRYLGYSL
jgi:8-oxo-dGTP pyrophosphatase MutT (NUDIX family)